ncbi:alpha/beta hydrolase [Rhizobium sp. BK512]|uniref:alpha/beta hydrolase n=1 Tax=unclassified Rhizobium TaxID=2613769 RepID=UPI001617BE1E|nr:alpha/beta hydrolase [Rhizobium sp. BK512]MBB3447294.1 pimeloyl-ACP methyl ester carboxylesterase [Rhizobium sp. BK379]MBB3565876.1 pimeloyl-ACP methyl ester carboxylesterase [Rhizobium sp. BK512]
MSILGFRSPASAATLLSSHIFTSARQHTHYLESGPSDGPLMIFVHGWPGIGLLWRAQMEAFAANGWHCIAPDLRGFGGSFAPSDSAGYSIEEIVRDLCELHDHLGGTPAIWVGHDWGSIAVGALAAHEGQRCRAAALVSWAYFPASNDLGTLTNLVDRRIYPQDRYPDGQWDYYRYYTTHFEAAVVDLDADIPASLASIFQPGDPKTVGKVSATATVTAKGGRFGARHRAPPTPPDTSLWPADDFETLVDAYKRRGFRSSCELYRNGAANAAYARLAPSGGRLSQPVLFLNGEYDQICTIIDNRQGDPMREACANLTVTNMSAGHWLPLELKQGATSAIRSWIDGEKLLGPN